MLRSAPLTSRLGIRGRAYAFLIISLFTGALLPIVLSFSISINIYEFFMLTYLTTIPFAMLLVSLTKKSNKVSEYIKDKKKLAIVVLVGFLSYIPLEFIISYSEHFVTASLTAVIFRTYPLLMLIFLPTMLKERLSKKQLVALLLAFVGLYIALTAGTLTNPFSNVNLPIVSLLILGALAYAFGSVVAKKYVFDMEIGVLVFNISLFVLFTFLFLISGAKFSAIGAGDVLAIFYVSLANNIVGFYMYFSALRALKTTLVTNIYFLSPFITVILANLILGESIKVYYIAVAALVTVGLIIQKFDAYGGTYLQRKKSTDRFVIFDVTSAFVASKEKSIIDAIENGGKILAIKLHIKYYNKIKELVKETGYEQVYTNFDSGLSSEANDFVKDIVGMRQDEMVIMKAGLPEESESFFANLQNQLNSLRGRSLTK